MSTETQRVVVRKLQEKRIPGRGTRKHRGPEVGNAEACFRHRKEASGAEVWRVGRVEWDMEERGTGAKSHGR